MAEWFAIALTIIGSGWSLVASYGYNRRRMEDLERDMKKIFDQSKEHYAHSDDEDAHWTRREREELGRKLEAMHKDIKDIVRRKYGDE